MKAIVTRFHRRFVRQTGGSVAVEFAMVALPLLMMLFSILELGMIYVVSATLEGAVYSSARTIRTGQTQSNKDSLVTFRNAVCANLSWLGSQCQSNLLVDVRTYSSFTAPPAAPMLNGDIDKTQMIFNTGSAGDIVLVRAWYNWPLLTPFPSGVQRTASGGAIITAATTFKNEPF